MKVGDIVEKRDGPHIILNLFKTFSGQISGDCTIPIEGPRMKQQQEVWEYYEKLRQPRKVEITTSSDQLTCDRCGTLVAYGEGDFNCTSIVCPGCLTPEERRSI